MNKIILFLTILAYACTGDSANKSAMVNDKDIKTSKINNNHSKDQKNDTKNEIIEEDWEKIQLEGIGSFSYPKTKLEVQNQNLKMLVDTLKKLSTVTAPPARFTLQQKGFNNFSNLNEYVRVMVETYSASKGDLLNSNLKVKNLTIKEQNQIKDFYKNDIDANFKKAGIEITKCYPVELLNINGAFSILLKYSRNSISKKGDILVNLYCFPNNDREFDLTLSCRENEKAKWEKDFMKIVKSFTVENKIKHIIQHSFKMQ